MNPYLLGMFAWKETTTLHVIFRALPPNNSQVSKGDGKSIDEPINLRGELHVSLFELLKSVMRLEGKLKGKFVLTLLQSLWRTYISQIPRQIEHTLGLPSTKEAPYPSSSLHELKTGKNLTAYLERTLRLLFSLTNIWFCEKIRRWIHDQLSTMEVLCNVF